MKYALFLIVWVQSSKIYYSQSLIDDKLYSLITKWSLLIVLISIPIIVLIIAGIDLNLLSFDTSWLKKDNENNPFGSMYSFPLGLGLVFSGSTEYNIFGFTYFQYSSYFMEPNNFMFSIIPGWIIVLAHNEYSVRYKTLILIVIFMIFVLASSLTAMISLLFVFIYIVIRSKKYYNRLLTIISLPFIVMFLSVYAMQNNTILFSDITNTLYGYKDSILFFSKFESGSMDAILQSFEMHKRFGDRPFNIKSYQLEDDNSYSALLASLSWGLYYIALLFSSVLSYKYYHLRWISVALFFVLISSLKTLGHMLPNIIPLLILLILYKSYILNIKGYLLISKTINKL